MQGFYRIAKGKTTHITYFGDMVVGNASNEPGGVLVLHFGHKTSDDAIQIKMDADDLLRIKHALPKSTREINLEQENARLRDTLEGMESENLRFQEALDGRRSING